ncbi:hypothetical protein OIU78_001033 [Salix suchowensis]|uniref:Uncharacterized protein n=1 Tax=Salix koriyanagi TaxID=2511006 RepID=A0A9Q0ZLR7_9ROSI|nr:hypothetical protein OIU78_001033 [Salix suchowensis]KAJ6738972.1 hypothetical protein OIU74_003856 [Salix koriyanagi]
MCNVAPAPIVYAFNPTENLQTIEVEGIKNDGESTSTENDDFCLNIIDFCGGYDEVDGVLASQAIEKASIYWVDQATRNMDGSCTSDAVDYGLKHGVCNSRLTNWTFS